MRIKISILNALLSSLFLLAFSASSLAVEEPVGLTSGKVSGVELDSGVTVFRGIPFAQPPVDDLRWRTPKAPIPWQGVLTADKFGPVCMQPNSAALMSEDCLYLNVWTDAESADEKRPVMVWIHGGGWAFGSSSTPLYDGEAFAENGVVLVSVNYRMNAQGFMAHPALSAESAQGVSGNYGILDHIAALEWVRDNVAGFGGDPDNVTIFGESAGGASIYSLLATPLAKGLFNKAISQSTWITPTNVTDLKHNNGIVDSAEAQGEKAVASKLQELGKTSADVLAQMRSLSPTEVLALEVGVSLTVDGWAFPKAPMDIFAEGSQNVVPLIAGINSGEGLLFIRPDQVFTTVDQQRQARQQELGEFAGDLLNYYVADSDDDIYTVEVDYNTDAWFARPTREIVESMARSSEDSYFYLFTRNPSNPDERSPHAAELAYVFNNLPAAAGETDREISKLINNYWVQFATTGSPNGGELPDWPMYDVESKPYQVIGAEVTQGSAFRKAELDELDRYLRDRYKSAE